MEWQKSHGVEAVEFTASQNALPKSSAEHATQLDGSPEQEAEGNSKTGKMGAWLRRAIERLKGTGG
jgi:hypothetical protein